MRPRIQSFTAPPHASRVTTSDRASPDEGPQARQEAARNECLSLLQRYEQETVAVAPICRMFERWLTDPADSSLDFSSPDCIASVMALPSALIQQAAIVHPSPDCWRIQWSARHSDHPEWLQHVPGWLSQLSLSQAVLPFAQAFNPNDNELFIVFTDKSGRLTSQLRPTGNRLLRDFYGLKCGARIVVPATDEQNPAALAKEIMDCIAGFKEASIRVVFFCNEHTQHVVPVVYGREAGSEWFLMANSLGVPPTDPLAIELARYAPVHCVTERFQLTRYGCRALAFRLAVKLSRSTTEGRHELSDKDLLGGSIPIEKGSKLHRARLPDILLVGAQDLGVVERCREELPRSIHAHRTDAGDMVDETLNDMLNRYCDQASERNDFLRLKTLALPLRACIQHFLEDVIRCGTKAWPDSLKRAFIEEASLRVWSATKHCSEAELLPRALEAIEAWLRTTGVLANRIEPEPRPSSAPACRPSALQRAVRAQDPAAVVRLLGPGIPTDRKLAMLRHRSRIGESALWSAVLAPHFDERPPLRELLDGILALDVGAEVKVELLRSRTAGCTLLQAVLFTRHEPSLRSFDECLRRAVDQGTLSLVQAVEVLDDLRCMPGERERPLRPPIDLQLKMRQAYRLGDPVDGAANHKLGQEISAWIDTYSELSESDSGDSDVTRSSEEASDDESDWTSESTSDDERG
jgi:hypothetical protein